MNKTLLTIIYLGLTLTTFAQRISEICPSNTHYFEMGLDRFPDWIELYNETDEPLSLEGFSISDDIGNLNKWTFTTQEIPSNDFFIISAEKNSLDPEIIGFSFKKKGATIYLANPEGEIVDSVRFPTMETDDSYGRIDGEWYFFDQPTPGSFNWLETAYKGYASNPNFSKPTGYYQVGSLVQLNNGYYDETLFYTLNGENPLDGELYSTAFVLKETVTIESIAIGDSLINSQPIRKTYFVGSMSHDLPIVNLCVDSLKLFDEITGICMPGPDAEPNFPYAGANYWGNEKVNCWFQYFDKDFNLIEELPVDLKVHGGYGSRIRPMKSFQLRAKTGKFESRFFDEKPIQNLERILLRNGGNDYCNTCMKDGNLHDYFIKNKLDVDLQGFSPVVVYINGKYHGIQYIREKVDRHYLASNYGVNPDSVNILEGPSLGIVEGTADGFQEIINYATEQDLSMDVHYSWMQDHIDIASMVDYFILELYVNNRDWPNNNLKLWNAAELPKWRYFCYDLDRSFNYIDESLEAREYLRLILDLYAETNPHVKIFNALLQNEAFEIYFINRYADLLNTVFEPESMIAAFNAHRDQVENDMDLHYTSWCTTMAEWQARYERTYAFVHTRPNLVRNELISVFDQNHTTEIGVDIYPYYAGTVKLNSLNLTSFPFLGHYFDSTPIELEAIPNVEGNFLYWQNARTGERFYDKKIRLNPENADRFVAIFSLDNTPFDLTVVPNPVHKYVTIRFFLPTQSEVVLNVFDSRGNLVQEIIDLDVLPSGNQFISWNAANLSPGMYTVRITTDTRYETTQLVKL